MFKTVSFLFMLATLFLSNLAQGQNFRLYQSTRATGSIQELDLNTGAILATNVGSLTGARGMAFSPLGGLYIALSSGITFMANAAATPTAALTFIAQTPHDVTFDAIGNMYVVTETNVYVFSSGLIQTLSFAHGMTSTTGDGNPNKGWSIAVRPDNGEIFVAAKQGLRHFSPVTGMQIGPTIAGSSFGMAGIAFTNSGFNNAFLYVGNVISGVDQIRVYDTNLNFLRAFFAPHIGNPIDLEIHPGNNDLYLFNTVVSLPVNRFTANEMVVATFNSSANPSRGSALGDFDAVLGELGLHLILENVAGKVRLQWDELAKVSVDFYRVERINSAQERTILGRVSAASTMSYWDRPPAAALSQYVVTAIGQNGEKVASATATWVETPQAQPFSFTQDANTHLLEVRSQNPAIEQIALRLIDMRGLAVRELMAPASQAKLSYLELPAGIYVLQAIGYSKGGNIAGVLRQRLRL